LEAIHLGCVPITTLASGLPEEVLAHCIIVESGDIDGQRRAIRDATAWSDDMFAATRGRLRQVAGRLHDWTPRSEFGRLCRLRYTVVAWRSGGREKSTSTTSKWRC
jgi:hypothetical protein